MKVLRLLTYLFIFFGGLFFSFFAAYQNYMNIPLNLVSFSEWLIISCISLFVHIGTYLFFGFMTEIANPKEKTDKENN